MHPTLYSKLYGFVFVFVLFVCLLLVGLFVCLFVCLFVGLFVCLFVGLFVCLFVWFFLSPSRNKWLTLRLQISVFSGLLIGRLSKLLARAGHPYPTQTPGRTSVPWAFLLVMTYLVLPAFEEPQC